MTSSEREKIKSEIQSLSAMGMTQTQVCEKLNENGVKTATGLSWNSIRLSNFLRGSKYKAKTAKPGKAVKPAIAEKKRGGSTARPAAKTVPPHAWMLPILTRKDWSAEKKIRVLHACVQP